MRLQSINRYIVCIAVLTLCACTKNAGTSTVSVSWEKLNVPYFGKPIQIEFTSSDTGYILGQDTITLNSILAKTNDGGKSWAVIKFSKQFLTDTAMGNIVKVNPSNKNSNVLFSGSNNILRSDNSGATWRIEQSATNTLVPPTSITYYFLDDSRIIAVGQDVYRSTDGGDNWTTVFVPDQYFSTLYLLQFTNQQIGYAAGGIMYDGNNNGVLIKTTDGGNTWKSIDYPLKQAIGGISFLNDNIGFINISLYSGDQATTSSTGSALYKTENGGDSWTAANSNIKLPVVQDAISKIYFKTEQDGYGIGANIYHTTDGGINWQIINPDENGKQYQVSFTGSSYCYAVDYYRNVFRCKL